MKRRSLLSWSLRTLLALVTLAAIGLGLGTHLYHERYARHKEAQQYFESLGVQVIVGDPCPPEFVYWIDGTGRKFGLPLTDTPDLIDRLAGRRLSHSPVRELSFRGGFQSDQRPFTQEIADNLPRLAPYVESIELPSGSKRACAFDVDAVDATIVHLSKLKELRHVSLYHWPVTDEHIKSLAAIPHLQVLTIYSSELSDASFASLQKVKELRFLAINSPKVTPEAAEAFHRDRPGVFARINAIDYGNRDGIYFYTKH